MAPQKPSYPAGVKPWAAVIAVAAAACSKSAPPAPAPVRIHLEPLPVSIAVPVGATVSQNSPTEIMVSARECIVLVSADASGPLTNPEYVPADAGDGKRSFTYRATIAGATYTCEPFVPRAEVACEERACRSLAPATL